MFLAHIELQSSLMDGIKASQKEDSQVCKVIDDVKNEKIGEFKVNACVREPKSFLCTTY